MKLNLARGVVFDLVDILNDAVTDPFKADTARPIRNHLQDLLDRDPAPIFGPARYAKGQIAVRCPSRDGYKTRAARLAGDHLKGRYSGREKAYILSPTKAERLRLLFESDLDASTITGQLT